MLLRFDPFRELDRLTQAPWGQPSQHRSFLPMDAWRRGEEFVLTFDLPGVDPATIEATVAKNVLSVKAERRWARGEGDEVLVSERPQGTFTRQVFLSEALDTAAVKAEYANGVLTVTIPVAEAAKPRRVEIAVGEGATPQAIDAQSTTAA